MPNTTTLIRLPAALLAFLLTLSTAPSLQAQDDAPSQVEVEARIVEVSEDETESLGWEYNVPWSTGIGIRFNDDFFESRINAFTPILLSPDGRNLLGLDLEFGAFDEGEQSYSAGLAYRRYCEGLAAILGFNVFYDNKQTQYDNSFGGLGLGLEYKSRFFEMNFQYEFTDDDIEKTGENDYGAPVAMGNQIVQQRFIRYEAAHQGLWGEIGVPLHELFPESWQLLLGELRAYGGYYYYEDAQFGGGFEGATGRLEWRVNNALTFDVAYYDDDRIAGSEVVGGFRWSIPLGNSTPIFYSPNAGNSTEGDTFIGSSAPLAGAEVKRRMGEDIYRMGMLQTSRSDASFASSAAGNVVALDNVIFANGPGNPATSNGIGTGASMGMGGTGTAETPLGLLDEAVAAANAASAMNGGIPFNVYAQGGVAYTGNLTPTESTNFIGSGKPVPAFGGFTFGEGPMPVLNGGIGAFGIASIGVTGYTINGGILAGFDPNADGDGIFLRDVANAIISCNTITVAEDAIDLELTAGVANWMLDENILNSANSDAFEVDVSGGSIATITSRNLMITGAGGDGIDLDLEDTSQFTNSTFDETSIMGVNGDAIFLGSTGAGIRMADLTFNRTTIDMQNAGLNGVDLDNLGGDATSTYTIAFHDLTILNTVDDAIEANTESAATLDLTLWDTTITDTQAGASGIDVDSQDTSNLTLTAMHTTLTNIGGIGFEIDNTDGATMGATISEAHLDNIGDDAMYLETDSTAATTLDVTGFEAMNVADEGIELVTFGASATGNVFTFADTIIDTTDSDTAGGGNGIELFGTDTSAFTATFTDTTLRNIGVPNLDGNAIAVETDTMAVARADFLGRTLINNVGEDGIDLSASDGSDLTFNFLGSGNRIEDFNFDGLIGEKFDTARLAIDIRNTVFVGIAPPVGPAANGINLLSEGTTPMATSILDFTGRNLTMSNVFDGVFAVAGNGADTAGMSLTFDGISVNSPDGDGFNLTENAGATLEVFQGAGGNTVNNPGANSLEVTGSIDAASFRLNGANLLFPLTDTP